MRRLGTGLKLLAAPDDQALLDAGVDRIVKDVTLLADEKALSLDVKETHNAPPANCAPVMVEAIARGNAGTDLLPVTGKHLPQLFALAIIQTLQGKQTARCLNALAKFVVFQLGRLPVVAGDFVHLG